MRLVSEVKRLCTPARRIHPAAVNGVGSTGSFVESGVADHSGGALEEWNGARWCARGVLDVVRDGLQDARWCPCRARGLQEWCHWRRKKMMKKMQDGVRKMARCKVVCKRCASCARWYARCKYAVEDEMNLCILSEGKRMLEPNSDIFGEFRRQRHRVLGLFLLLTVCLFTICIIGWPCSSRV